MFVSALVVAVLAASAAGPGVAQAQQRRPQGRTCVTPSGFLGNCRFGRCPGSGGPSRLCDPGYTCCVHVTTGRPQGTSDRLQFTFGQPQGTPGSRPQPSRRKTLLNPQFECGGQPAPVEEALPDPSAIVFPRTRRDVTKLSPKPSPGLPTAKPGTVFVTGGAPEPETNAVGVGVVSPTRPNPPKPPSLQDVLARIDRRPKSPTRRPKFGNLSPTFPTPPPPRSPPGQRRGRHPNRLSGPPRKNNPRRNFYPPRRNFDPPRRNFRPQRRNSHPHREHGRQNHHKPSRNYHQPHRNYHQSRQNYHRQPRNYHHPPRRNHYHPRQNQRRPPRGLFKQLLSVLGLPTRRRHRRSPQTPDEQEAFEAVWQEYQERVRTGDAPPGFTRQDILEAYRAAAAEAERNSPSPANGGWTCGAVLISERYMLTAAHCLLGGRPQVVRLGDLNLTSTADGAPQEYQVQDVIKHPEYRHPLVYHDLALLKLDRTVQFSEHVKPFCLYDGRRSLVGEVSHVSGWGATEFGGGLSDILLGGNVTIWAQSRCDEVYSRQPGFKRRLSNGITSNLLCAGGGKQDACQGDSGGPMTVLTEEGTRLAGIVSAGIGCGSPGIPGLYTNVASYIDWIDEVVYGGQTA